MAARVATKLERGRKVFTSLAWRRTDGGWLIKRVKYLYRLGAGNIYRPVATMYVHTYIFNRL
jgi:hypothetical protein